MNRALRVAPWLFAAGAIALIVAGVGFDTLGGSSWRFLLGAMGAAACLIGLASNRMPRLFLVAVAVAGTRVILFDTETPVDRVGSLNLWSGLGNLAVGVSLLVILTMALRFRRGGLDQRDGIDLLTVAIGAVPLDLDRRHQPPRLRR